MARFDFGGPRGHRGKEHTDVPVPYLQWMKGELEQGRGNFNITQGGRRLNAAEISQMIDQEIARRSGRGQPSQPQRPGSPVAPPAAASPAIKPAAGYQGQNVGEALNAGKWVWAKSKVITDGLPAVGLDLAIKKYDQQNFMFVILDPDEKRMVTRGLIPAAEIKTAVESQQKDGRYVFGNKPTDILKAIVPPKKSGGGNTIPDEFLTAEQKSVEEKFVAMLNSPRQSHMVIDALAGSGKTTMLKHLAWKYGQGKKWLYLVFNSVNKEEAKGEFPPTFQVETTNGWAGREVLGKNHLKPTSRIVEFDLDQRKADLIADSAPFENLMTQLKVPNHIQLYGPDPKRMQSTHKSLWYILRGLRTEFKREALKVLGLAKSYAIDPRDTNALEGVVEKLMDQYDLNTSMENTKEKLEKNSSWATEYLDDLMGESFLARNFKDELKQAAIWLMQQSMPHVNKEKHTGTTQKQKGVQQTLGELRDFDDDLWFAAIHANELKWPKYDVVFADEVQDFNAAQKVMLKKLAENGAKVVIVGDENQAIYRFRGADSGAFASTAKMLGDMSDDKDIKRTLTRNFRSRQAIIDMANEEGKGSGHVSNLVRGKNFKSGPGKIGEGEATSGDVSYDDAFDMLKQEMKDMGEVRQTAFLARTNEPLVHASLNLMKNGIPFIILGKDLATDLLKHIDRINSLFFLKPTDPVSELQYKISEFNEEQQEKHAGKAATASKMHELKEVTESMLAAMEQFAQEKQYGTVADFRKWLHVKFGGLDMDNKADRAEYQKRIEEQNPVILSTVHKSKGLQFQRVFILRDDLWPHPRTTRPEDMAQELNNRYIGRTRAEDELHVLKLKGQPGYKDTEEGGGEEEKLQPPPRRQNW